MSVGTRSTQTTESRPRGNHVHHLRHVAVARGTLDAGFHVPLVREVHGGRWGEAVDAHPWRFFPHLGERGELLNLGALGLDVFVADHALGHARNGGGDRSVGVHVTRQAFHLVVGHVGLVRVGNRLLDGTRGPEGGRCRGNQQSQHNSAENEFTHA